jgi:hypothetical protein
MGFSWLVRLVLVMHHIQQPARPALGDATSRFRGDNNYYGTVSLARVVLAAAVARGY